MHHDHIVSELLRKHSELAGQIADCRKEQARLARMLTDVANVLKIYRPDLRPHTIPSKRPHPRARGETANAALAVLRQADRPLTTREIAARVLSTRNGTEPDERMIGLLVPSVGMVLKGRRDKGLVTDGGSVPKRWSLAVK